ncbi:hypothetical protein MMC16_007648 [Acarospora aff. strigata]|nr:hypothetical protein [Acarospora aff. strigata]
MSTHNAHNPMTHEGIRAMAMEIATEVLRRFRLENAPVDTFVEAPAVESSTVEIAVDFVDSDSSFEAYGKAAVESSIDKFAVDFVDSDSSVEAPIEAFAAVESSVVFALKTTPYPCSVARSLRPTKNIVEMALGSRHWLHRSVAILVPQTNAKRRRELYGDHIVLQGVF